MNMDLACAIGYLELLAARLRTRGWDVETTVPGDRWPSVRVVNPCLRALNETVMAAPADDQGAPSGHWCFWFSWAEHIAKITDIDAALTRIERVLSTRPSEPEG